jgi:hypothetical protein
MPREHPSLKGLNCTIEDLLLCIRLARYSGSVRRELPKIEQMIIGKVGITAADWRAEWNPRRSR